MDNVKKTYDYYLMGYNDSKAGRKKQNINVSGMARRLYIDGFRDAKLGKASH